VTRDSSNCIFKAAVLLLNPSRLQASSIASDRNPLKQLQGVVYDYLVLTTASPREPKSLMPSVHTQSNTTDLTLLGATTVMLTTLRGAGSLTSIPYLQDAAGLALGIIDAIQVRAS
jgi:hypothetical protein